MNPRLIYKDRHVLVIDKPAGMPSVGVAGGNPNTLASWIIENYPKQKKLKEAPCEAGLIHRLDNDTSGVIVAARSDKAYKRIKEAWSGGEVLKEYRCLVLGQIPPHGKITKLIAHHPEKSNKMMVVESAAEAKKLNARYAETEFELLEGFLDYSFLKIKISTGVRHQIRCHLASIGYPVAGDKLYQRTKHGPRDWLKTTRHFLHASRVGLPHPASGKYVEFESPLPGDIQKALDTLRRP